MKITVLPGCELSSDLVLLWREIQESNPHLDSPYFCPEFTLAIAAAREDVEVAVIEEGSRTVAFFPFQREKNGRPVGGRLSDYHGVICAPDFVCDPRALLRACSLMNWDFDRLPVAQRLFTRFHRHFDTSPLIDLRAGFEAYLNQRRAARSELSRKRPAIEREIGPLRFVTYESDKAVFQQIIEWKSHKYGEGVFSYKWVRAALDRIHAIQTAGFAGTLSALYAGDKLVAGHFGMRSRTVWHWWFPTYAQDYSRYSPGLLLLLSMAEHAAGLGLSVIDLGKGQEAYKSRFKNAEIPVAEGSIERPSITNFRRQLQRGMQELKHGVRESVIGTPLEKPVRKLHEVKKRMTQGRHQTAG